MADRFFVLLKRDGEEFIILFKGQGTNPIILPIGKKEKTLPRKRISGDDLPNEVGHAITFKGFTILRVSEAIFNAAKEVKQPDSDSGVNSDFLNGILDELKLKRPEGNDFIIDMVPRLVKLLGEENGLNLMDELKDAKLQAEQKRKQKQLKTGKFIILQKVEVVAATINNGGENEDEDAAGEGVAGDAAAAPLLTHQPGGNKGEDDTRNDDDEEGVRERANKGGGEGREGDGGGEGDRTEVSENELLKQKVEEQRKKEEHLLEALNEEKGKNQQLHQKLMQLQQEKNDSETKRTILAAKNESMEEKIEVMRNNGELSRKVAEFAEKETAQFRQKAEHLEQSNHQLEQSNRQLSHENTRLKARVREQFKGEHHPMVPSVNSSGIDETKEHYGDSSLASSRVSNDDSSSSSSNGGGCDVDVDVGGSGELQNDNNQEEEVEPQLLERLHLVQDENASLRIELEETRQKANGLEQDKAQLLAENTELLDENTRLRNSNHRFQQQANRVNEAPLRPQWHR